jgi:hypothetical protein
MRMNFGGAERAFVKLEGASRPFDAQVRGYRVIAFGNGIGHGMCLLLSCAYLAALWGL